MNEIERKQGINILSSISVLYDRKSHELPPETRDIINYNIKYLQLYLSYDANIITLDLMNSLEPMLFLDYYESDDNKLRESIISLFNWMDDVCLIPEALDVFNLYKQQLLKFHSRVNCEAFRLDRFILEMQCKLVHEEELVFNSDNIGEVLNDLLAKLSLQLKYDHHQAVYQMKYSIQYYKQYLTNEKSNINSIRENEILNIKYNDNLDNPGNWLTSWSPHRLISKFSSLENSLDNSINAWNEETHELSLILDEILFWDGKKPLAPQWDKLKLKSLM